MKKSLKLIVALFSKETFIVRRLRIVFVQNGDYHAGTIAEPNKSKTYKVLRNHLAINEFLMTSPGDAIAKLVGLAAYFASVSLCPLPPYFSIRSNLSASVNMLSLDNSHP